MSAQTPSNPLTEKERMATIALGAIKKLDAKYEARPLPGTENSIRLNRKAVDCELRDRCKTCILECAVVPERSEEHTSEPWSLMRISYAFFCFKKKKLNQKTIYT